MKPHERYALLDELTPELRAYFFPGLVPSAPPLKQSRCLAKKSLSTIVADFFYEDVCAPEMEPETEVEEVLPDPRVQDFLKELSRIQEKYNISIEELEALLKYTVTLSHLHISRYGKITLSDFGNREIKMPNIAKSLYFLYLRHPEGLRYKDIAGHRDELLGIYRKITGRDDPEAIEKSIDLLVDPYANGLNVNASRIKTAFRNAVDDRIAQFYYISGAAGEIKKVPLDRDLVIWEY